MVDGNDAFVGSAVMRRSSSADVAAGARGYKVRESAGDRESYYG